MSDKWVAPVFGSVAGIFLAVLIYKMYSGNKESLASYEKYLQQDDIDSKVSGGKSKRRKHRKNASKKRR